MNGAKVISAFPGRLMLAAARGGASTLIGLPIVIANTVFADGRVLNAKVAFASVAVNTRPDL